MKNLKVFIIAFLALGLLSSCVSNRKYKEAMSAKQNTEQRLRNLQADYSKLEGDMQQLQATNARALRDKEMTLNEKDKTLTAEEQKMKEMKELVDAERNAISNLKQEVCSALKCFTPDELTVTVRDGKLYVSMSDKLLFPSGSDVVNARGKEAVSMLAAVLNNSKLEIMVEGHTDPVPISTARNKDNWDLSAHRATSVTRLFVENGIPPQRIIAGGRGEYHPIAENTTAEGRQMNRRTEIVLAPKLDKLWKLTEQPGTTTSTDGNE